MKKIETYVLGMVQVNTYLLWQDEHVLIIDPGSASLQLMQAIDAKQGIVDGIVLTHGHFDHIGGVDALVEKYHCNVYINEWDLQMLKDSYLNASACMGLPEVIVKADAICLNAGEHTIGSFAFRFLYAPGHSDGCAMILWDNNLFSGDVLFAGSIGRTDLPGGNLGKMMNSLKVFATMDPDMKIYPGHGPATTLKQELKFNLYLAKN